MGLCRVSELRAIPVPFLQSVAIGPTLLFFIPANRDMVDNAKGMAFLIFLLHTLLCIFIAKRFGATRKMGQKWSLFFLITLGFIIGLVCILFSDHRNRKPPHTDRQILYKELGAILVILIITFYGMFAIPYSSDFGLSDNAYFEQIIFAMLTGAGIIGMCYYQAGKIEYPIAKEKMNE